MIEVLLFLLSVSVGLTIAFAHRISRSAREWKRQDMEHGRRVAANYGFMAEEDREADWDLRILRWFLLSWVITVFWAIITAAAYLVAAFFA